MEYLIKNKDDTIKEIYELAINEDMRSYVFLVSMINYCKKNKLDLVAELSALAAFVSINFLNYIKGMLQLSYTHQKDAIEYDPDNWEYKRVFLTGYCKHPDIEHDLEYEKNIAENMI